MARESFRGKKTQLSPPQSAVGCWKPALAMGTSECNPKQHETGLYWSLGSLVLVQLGGECHSGQSGMKTAQRMAVALSEDVRDTLAMLSLAFNQVGWLCLRDGGKENIIPPLLVPTSSPRPCSP